MKSVVLETLSSVVLGLVVVTPACAPFGPPSWRGSPAVSKDGVQMTVARQSCTENVDTDFPGEDLVEATLEVEVRNATPAALLVKRDQFRLVAPDGAAVRPVTWRSGDPLTVAAGAVGAFELRFMSRGTLACDAELALDPQKGVTTGAAPVHLAGLHFVPRPTL